MLSKIRGIIYICTYKKLVHMLDNLIDEVGEDESHPLASLMEIIGVLIEQYETQNTPELDIEN